MANDVGKAYVQIVASAEGISGSIQNVLNGEASQAGTQAGRIISNNVGQSMGKTGKAMSLGLTTPIVGALTGAVKTASGFEDAMAKVQAISGATGEDFDKLTGLARDMGSKTKFSASEAAEGLQYMAMAGWDTAQMVGGLPGILDLAAASGESLGTTSDIVTDAMTAFGMQAEEAGHFADVIAAASNNANTNVSMLGESFKYVAPVAGSMGFSVEDTSVALGLMANSGIKASQAGTSLRTLLTNMAKPTDQMKHAMDTLGVSPDDGHGNMKSLSEIMGDLRAGFGDLQISEEDFNDAFTTLNDQLANGELTENQYNDALDELTEAAFGAEGALKAKTAAALAGKQGMSALLAIVNASPDDFNDLSESINNADGTAKEMAKIMQGTLGGKMTVLKSQLEELAISFGNVLMPVLSKVIEHVQNIVDWFNGLDDSQRKMIITIAGIVAVVGPALVIGAKIIGVISALAGIIPILTGAFALLVSPVGIVIGVIAALIAVGVLLYKNWAKVKESAGNVWEGIKSAFQSIKDKVSGVWDNVRNTTSETWSNVKEKVSSAVESAKDKVTGVWDAIKTKTANVWNTVKTTVGDVVNDVKLKVSTKIESVKTKVTSIWDTIQSKTSSIWESVKTKISNTVENIKNTVGETFESIKKKITQPMEDAKAKVDSIVQKIKGFFPISIGNIFSNIKLPKFRVTTTSGPLGIPVPKIEKYDNYRGGIAKALSIYTVAERGQEAIVPLTNSSYMRPFAQAIAKEMPGSSGTYYITIDGAKDPKAVVDELLRRVELKARTV